MAASPNDSIRELKAVLAERLPWHGAKIGFLAQFLPVLPSYATSASPSWL